MVCGGIHAPPLLLRRETQNHTYFSFFLSNSSRDVVPLKFSLEGC